MKILLNFNNKINKRNRNKLGGIETVNLNLFNNLKNKFKYIYLKPQKKINSYDIIISSNDAQIFNKYKSNKYILWLHNKLQIEKAIRKRQFFPIISNNIEAVFVSNYLKNITSKIYNFKKKTVIPNFLDKQFENLKISYKRKQMIVWAVSRDRGLKETINLWKKRVYPKFPKAEFHIFGNIIQERKKLKKYNIYLHKRVNKDVLINYYKKSRCSICLGYDETFCLNAIESMSCGTPVLSFKMTALNDLIINNVNGFKVDNFNDLGNKIEKLLIPNKKRIKLIQKTFNFSKKYYFKKIKLKWIEKISK